MKNLIFALLSPFFALTTFAQSWTTLNIPSASRYDDLFFLNDSLAWACNSMGDAFKTTDAGLHWIKQPVSPFNYLRSIEFMDADTGFCGGLFAAQSLFRTTNGGQTWTNISATVPNLNGGICGLSCPGEKAVFGCGVWSSPAYVIKSLDGGQSWTKIDMSLLASALVDILFINQDTGWVSGRAPFNTGGIILHTTDGGNSWEVVHQTTVPGDYVWKMQRLDAEHWFASIERDYSITATTNILKSLDGGLNWESVLVKNTHFRLQAVGFITPEHGWAGDGILFETKDGGNTWAYIPSEAPTGGSYNRFVRINAQTAFLSGDNVYRYDAATSNTKAADSEQRPQAVHHLSVAPNPTEGAMTVSVRLGEKTQVILKMYSIDGKSAEILWTGEHPAGEYSIYPDLDHKPPGVYVLYLKTHHGAQHILFTKL